MKGIWKILLKWAVWFVVCFLVIYLIVFFGGWKLFESQDPLLIEIGAALILSVFVSIVNEVITGLEKRIKSLEEKIKEFEKKVTCVDFRRGQCPHWPGRMQVSALTMHIEGPSTMPVPTYTPEGKWHYDHQRTGIDPCIPPKAAV